MVFVSWALIQIAARAKFAVMGRRWEHGRLLKSFVEWWLSQDMSRPETHGTPWTMMNHDFIIFHQWFYQWTISTFLARWFEMDSTDSTDSTGDGHSISTSISLGSATGVLGVLGVTTARWIWVGSNTSSEKLSMSITKLSWDQLVDTWAWFTLLEITASEVTNDQLIHSL